VKLLTALASLTSAFVRNARLADRARSTESRKREHEIAQQIYQRLLPDREPDYPGLEIAAVCQAAERIGGDYYGFLEMPDGSLGIAMADISGHGVGAGLYMAATKGVLQAEAKRMVSPSDLLRRTNEALSADFSKFDIFATAFVARFATDARRLEYSNSGHHPPLFVREDGRVERLDRGGLALGVLPNVIYQEESRCFDPGDVLVVYTDGLIEAKNADNEFYGQERLERVTVGSRNLSAPELRDQILVDLARHTGDIPFHDDVTLVVARGVEPETVSAEDSDE
jgi:sigma-B regulation protein RsbU (phosphoserine phosphatase)